MASLPTEFPYYVTSVKKYRSPHSQDLSFPKGTIIKVTGLAPKTTDAGDDDEDDDEDVWLVGELKDGTAKGTFPGDNVVLAPDEVDEVASEVSEAPTAGDDIATQTGKATEAPPAVEEPPEPAPTPAAAEPAAPTPVAAADPATTTTASEAPATPKAAPPPPKPKPSGLAARIAAFNQPAAASSPPPLPRGKPAGSTGGWKRPAPKEGEKAILPGQSPASQASKPSFSPAKASAPSTSNDSEAATDTPADNDRNAGFSAADAASSIKMSLKERMAALQRGERSGEESTGAAGDARSPPPLAAKPGRLTAEKRAVAMAGMGLGSGQQTPSSDSLPLQRSGSIKSPSSEVPEADSLASIAEPATYSATDDTEKTTAVDPEEAASAGDGEQAEVQELSPEEEEAQRRAAITQRLARLGGQRVGGGGPPIFGAPRPIPPKKSTAGSIASPTSATEGKTEASPAGVPPPTGSQTDEDEKPKTLTVPRRAAPPRRKRSAEPSAVTSPEEASSGGMADPTLATQDIAVPAAPDATEPPPADLPDEGPTQGPELVSGPPPPENIADASRTAEHLRDLERTLPLAGAGIEAEKGMEAEERQLDEQTLTANVAGGEDLEEENDDELLKRRAAQLDQFLARGGDSSETDSPLEESQTPSDAIPPGLAKQLGLNSASDSQEQLTVDVESARSVEGSEVAPSPSALTPADEADEIGPALGSSAGDEIEPLEEDADQTVIGEDVNAARPETPPPQFPPQLPSSPAPRPPSTSGRPPIPGTQHPLSHASVNAPPARATPPPPGAAIDRGGSASSVGRPPVPRSPPPIVPRQGSISETLDYASQRPVSGEFGGQPPMPLAAPLPRRAIPIDEDEEDEAAADDAENAEAATRIPELPTEDRATQDEVAQAPEEAEEQEQEPVELTEEQQEAQRRAAIAKRMAALGGQRMGGMPPIMGAPMPPRRKPSADPAPEPAREVEEENAATVAPAKAAQRGVPRGGMAIPGMTFPQATAEQEDTAEEGEEKDLPEEPNVDEEAEVGDEQEEGDLSVHAPPKPMSPPPPPVPGSQAQRRGSLTKPMSPPPRPPPSSSTDSATELSRKTSIKPPVPAGRPPPLPPGQAAPYSIEGTLMGDGAQQEEYEYENEDAYGEHGEEDPYAGEQREEGGAAFYAEPSHAPPPPPAAAPAAPSSSHAPSSLPPSLLAAGEKHSPRDIDLMPPLLWWRNGFQPPPSITQLPGSIHSVAFASPAPGSHTASIRILFEDYSSTSVRISWNEADLSEETTALEQHHDFPPPRPRREDLKAWSDTIGVDVAKSALLALSSGGGSSKSRSSAYPTSYALVASLLHNVQSAIPPVGLTFGATVLHQVGSTILASEDDVRVGDIVILEKAEFKGKKGLGSYHVTYGSSSSALLCVVVELVDPKKRRIRVVTVSEKDSAQVEDVGLRLEELKSGVVKVMRAVRRGAWIEGF